jgi:hypothetical protein
LGLPELKVLVDPPIENAFPIPILGLLVPVIVAASFTTELKSQVAMYDCPKQDMDKPKKMSDTNFLFI